MQPKRLIVMAGLPGSGKSTISEGLARNLKIPILSVDPIEASMWRQGIPRNMTGIAAYEVAASVAEENLKLGLSVIVDAVNPVEAARNTWVQLAKRQDAHLSFIECVCADRSLHKTRVHTRVRNIPGMPEVSWERVEARRHEYEPWNSKRIIVDTSEKAPALLIAGVISELEIQ